MTKLQQKMAAAKAQVTKKKNGTKLEGFSDEKRRALSMAFAYEEVLGDYLHKPSLTYFTNLRKGGSLSYLSRAAVMAEEFGITYQEFIQAHFYWTTRWFNRQPHLRELCSEGKEFTITKSNGKKETKTPKYPARWRVAEYLKLKEGGLLEEWKKSVVIPSKKIDLEIVDRINRNRVEQLMKTWDMSEEDVFAQFALSGFFDTPWMKRQEVYKKLMKEGRLCEAAA